MIRDMLSRGESLLFLGRPGVGKTTAIRELARVLSDELHKRVVIVDTSNEIGGDGDVPHPAIGGARRMQVADAAQQHRVMVEAVQNHMPEVVIVDEIGTEEEALACRTIAERGVMLVGTAHGQYLANLLKNPTLSDLVGGISCVTLGDDEARARGTQKTVQERSAAATFPVVLEMRRRDCWVAHRTEASVDALLQSRTPEVELRSMGDAEVCVQRAPYDHGEEDIASSAPRHRDDQLHPHQHPQRQQQRHFSGGGAALEGSYAWANRLGGVPDKDALQELAMLGYLGGERAPAARPLPVVVEGAPRACARDGTAAAVARSAAAGARRLEVAAAAPRATAARARATPSATSGSSWRCTRGRRCCLRSTVVLAHVVVICARRWRARTHESRTHASAQARSLWRARLTVGARRSRWARWRRAASAASWRRRPGAGSAWRAPPRGSGPPTPPPPRSAPRGPPGRRRARAPVTAACNNANDERQQGRGAAYHLALEGNHGEVVEGEVGLGAEAVGRVGPPHDEDVLVPHAEAPVLVVARLVGQRHACHPPPPPPPLSRRPAQAHAAARFLARSAATTPAAHAPTSKGTGLGSCARLMRCGSSCTLRKAPTPWPVPWR
eukprot:scaffold2434_cov278-Prasinococcus_capsulatus_cf.AAC.5